jgi:hypothetical protein
MSKRMRFVTGLSFSLAIFGGAAAYAQERGGQPPEMSAEEKAKMEAWEKARAVGEQHKLLADYMAGQWEFTNKMWMEPGADPMESKGTCTSRMILGGRFIETSHKGDFMGEPFEGIGITGYDNMKKKYIGTWVDNMGTCIISVEGSYDAGSKTFTYTCSFDCPFEQSPVKVREVIRLVDKNKHVLEWYETRAGKENKTMEITYTRKGA